MTKTAWQIAVVGAGPVGLALALHAARLLPEAGITLFDARPADRDVGADPRTLALSTGSVQFLRRLDAWPAAAAEPILQVHVSQAPPSLSTLFGEPAVRLRAADLGVPFLGAVLDLVPGHGHAPGQRAVAGLEPLEDVDELPADEFRQRHRRPSARPAPGRGK